MRQCERLPDFKCINFISNGNLKESDWLNMAVSIRLPTMAEKLVSFRLQIDALGCKFEASNFG